MWKWEDTAGMQRPHSIRPKEEQAGRWGKPGEGGLDFGGPSRPEAGFGWLE